MMEGTVGRKGKGQESSALAHLRHQKKTLQGRKNDLSRVLYKIQLHNVDDDKLMTDFPDV